MKTLITIISIIILLSCNSKEQRQEDKQSIDNIKTNESINRKNEKFMQNLREKKKIFLIFWADMSFDDYNRAMEILIKKNTVRADLNQYSPYKFENSIYLFESDWEMPFEPIFTNSGKLVSIRLMRVNKSVYNLYKEKYKLPELTKYNRIVEEAIENNPDYNPIYSYERDGKKINLSAAYFDNHNSLQKGEIIRNKKISFDMSTKLKFSPIVAETDSSVIVFEQSKIKSYVIKYSLSDKEAFKKKSFQEVMEDKYYIGSVETSNSVLRITQTIIDYEISITYKSKPQYEYELGLKNKSLKDSIKKSQLRDEMRKRTLNEI
ncbi:hypothetical protein ACSVH2_08785 [Flavobacterium sp. RSB2_4_14]|uniref:hypothetical protein n=1 Tax=Flavobacterium sp. RSB2_4_14 TaxID=3447665 RepID=UPI003F2EAD27